MTRTTSFKRIFTCFLFSLCLSNTSVQAIEFDEISEYTWTLLDNAKSFIFDFVRLLDKDPAYLIPKTFLQTGVRGISSIRSGNFAFHLFNDPLAPKLIRAIENKDYIQAGLIGATILSGICAAEPALDLFNKKFRSEHYHEREKVMLQRKRRASIAFRVLATVTTLYIATEHWHPYFENLDENAPELTRSWTFIVENLEIFGSLIAEVVRSFDTA